MHCRGHTESPPDSEIHFFFLNCSSAVGDGSLDEKEAMVWKGSLKISSVEFFILQMKK